MSLHDQPDITPIDKESIVRRLNCDVEVRVYDSVDSTNDEAKRYSSDLSRPVLYIAGEQTAGRGRKGHSFCSPRNTGLYMSLALPVSDFADTHLVTCAAAVAVCEAIEYDFGRQLSIKWVNDIYKHRRKAGGILTEIISDENNKPVSVVIGIGLNLNSALPDELWDIATNIFDYPQENHTGTIVREKTAASITNLICEYFSSSDHNSVLEKYKELNICVGGLIIYNRDGVTHYAEGVDIDPDGGLIIKEDGELITLRSGEVSVQPYPQ